MDHWICITCGTQFAPSERPPQACPICCDQRQYIGFNGQQWTTLARMQQEGPGYDAIGVNHGDAR